MRASRRLAVTTLAAFAVAPLLAGCSSGPATASDEDLLEAPEIRSDCTVDDFDTSEYSIGAPGCAYSSADVSFAEDGVVVLRVTTWVSAEAALTAWGELDDATSTPEQWVQHLADQNEADAGEIKAGLASSVDGTSGTYGDYVDADDLTSTASLTDGVLRITQQAQIMTLWAAQAFSSTVDGDAITLASAVPDVMGDDVMRYVWHVPGGVSDTTGDILEPKEGTDISGTVVVFSTADQLADMEATFVGLDESALTQVQVYSN